MCLLSESMRMRCAGCGRFTGCVVSGRDRPRARQGCRRFGGRSARVHIWSPEGLGGPSPRRRGRLRDLRAPSRLVRAAPPLATRVAASRQPWACARPTARRSPHRSRGRRWRPRETRSVPELRPRGFCRAADQAIMPRSTRRAVRLARPSRSRALKRPTERNTSPGQPRPDRSPRPCGDPPPGAAASSGRLAAAHRRRKCRSASSRRLRALAMHRLRRKAVTALLPRSAAIDLR